ncbi:hypothetical protein GJAV_G00184000 [Gymnothorax javanicus]|nr:hypothetical protein GJAV_G00184000 [Gymnothorax javanicus]
MELLYLAAVLLSLWGGRSILGTPLYLSFTRNDTRFQHLVLHQDSRASGVYIGARDHLFQLDEDLQLREEVATGPVSDSRDCLPPINEANCPQARRTSNHNKLLLVDPYVDELITCGSVYQGTCQKRGLASIGEVRFSTDRPVDTQYVAANDPLVSTVGVVAQGRGQQRVLFVGRGYTGSQPPISTRALGSPPFFSYEETAKLAVAGRLSEYDHHFVTAFARRAHVYFLFYRRDLKSPTREYRTYVSRICLDDPAYYSYVELPLLCRSRDRKSYSLLQAASVGQGRPGTGAESGPDPGAVLLGVFSTRLSSNQPSEDSALCAFPLAQLDRLVDATRDLCYTDTGGEAAYIEYEVKSACASLPTNTLEAYPCGSDHTPSPMASRVPMEAETLLASPAARLTAVVASVRAGHTIAFLGDSKGNLHKVYLGPGGEAQQYASISIQPDEPISADLLLDHTQENLFVMTSSKVEKRPVAECSQHLHCGSCLSARDPYCGWCVLEGRCVQSSECAGAQLAGRWLWSFDEEQRCLTVQSVSPSNISREERRDILLSLPGLPGLGEGAVYTCVFHTYESPAAITDTGVTCPSPDPANVPATAEGEDHVKITLSLRFGEVTVAAHDFTFYDCGAVQNLSQSMPCHGCVNSSWGCNWCVEQHTCSHEAACVEGVIIHNKHFRRPISVLLPTAKAFDKLAPKIPTTHPVPMMTPPTTILATTATSAVPTLVPVAPKLSSITPYSPEVTAQLTPLLSRAAPTALSVATPSLAVHPRTGNDNTTRLQAEVSLPKAANPQEQKGEAELRFGVRPNATLGPFVGVTTDLPVRDGDLSQEKHPFLAESFNNTPSVVNIRPTTPSNAAVPPQRSAGPNGTLTALPASLNEEPGSNLPSLGRTETVNRSSASPLPQDHSDPGYQHPPTTDLPLPGEEGDPSRLGASSCPCVQELLSPTHLPVSVERTITLVGRNLHLFQEEALQFECVLMVEGHMEVVGSHAETDAADPSLFYITCQSRKYSYSAPVGEYKAPVYVRRTGLFQVDSPQHLHVSLYNCSVGRSDCSLCQTAEEKLGCVWCGGSASSCLYNDSCTDPVVQTCPAPVIHSIEPLSGPLEGGTAVTISGSNLGQKAQDVQDSITVAGLPCALDLSRYQVSSRIVCVASPSDLERSGEVAVGVKGGGRGLSEQSFSYQNPIVKQVSPERGPKSGGTSITITGRKLRTGQPSEISVWIGEAPCLISAEIEGDRIECRTSGSNETGGQAVLVRFGSSELRLQGTTFHYTPDPNVTQASPNKSFLCGGRVIKLLGHNLDVVQEARMRVTVFPSELQSRRRRRRMVPDPSCPAQALCTVTQFMENCEVNSSSLILCRTPAVEAEVRNARVQVDFLLDNLQFDFASVSQSPFTYELNPVLYPLNYNDQSKPYRHKPGSIISVKGENLDLAISKEEVVALIGDGVCAVKTLTQTHLYCEPPTQQPSSATGGRREGVAALPEFTVQMGNLNFSLGKIQYDTQIPAPFPLEAQIGVGVGASIVALIVLIIVLIYRRKSKQALRDYKKVQIQLENLETSVRDRCKKEFTDLMTEMMDMSSDLVGSSIPFLDYRMYAERIFFPGHRESPLCRSLDVQESRRQTVEQGLIQLSNLLNSKLFLTKFIHTLEGQRTFTPRDRADLVEQYTAKNPKLMLRRTESVVEKLLTNWMSISLYSFLRDSVGEPLYMLFRAIKHQVDKGPVDAVTGKAKYTLNDNRLLREDVEYRTLTLNVLVQGGAGNEAQAVPSRVLDCDTITQVKEKILDQAYKSSSFSLRPHADSLDLEWRSGVAGHLILSDEDLTSVVQGNWKRLNTLQHYKVPDGATVTLVQRHTKHIHHENQDYIAGENEGDCGSGGSLRERERAKAIPEIYLTRLLSMKGTLQKFVDDLFQVILSSSRPVPLPVKYFFDLLDEQAASHGITDTETIHIWKTNSLPLRFWVNILKNPQFIFDVQASDNVDAVLSVIAQTFMDSCTIAEHKLGRDSPINKLLYARDIPRYKQMVERYYTDIRQTANASDQEMNAALAELSRNYSGELNYLVALHELYKYINKYYDQIISALEEDSTAQKMQLGYRLQQMAAAVENKSSGAMCDLTPNTDLCCSTEGTKLIITAICSFDSPSSVSAGDM